MWRPWTLTPKPKPYTTNPQHVRWCREKWFREIEYRKMIVFEYSSFCCCRNASSNTLHPPLFTLQEKVLSSIRLLVRKHAKKCPWLVMLSLDDCGRCDFWPFDRALNPTPCIRRASGSGCGFWKAWTNPCSRWTLHPKPETRNPKPETEIWNPNPRNPKNETRNPNLGVGDPSAQDPSS